MSNAVQTRIRLEDERESEAVGDDAGLKELAEQRNGVARGEGFEEGVPQSELGLGEGVEDPASVMEAGRESADGGDAGEREERERRRRGFEEVCMDLLEL